MNLTAKQQEAKPIEPFLLNYAVYVLIQYESEARQIELLETHIKDMQLDVRDRKKKAKQLGRAAAKGEA